MGFFGLFGKKETPSERRVTKEVKKPKQTLVNKAFGVARAAGKQVKQTAGNVKANVAYARDHEERVFPIEKRGFRKLGTYKPDSRDLKWTIARYQRDGYTVATANAVNGYGENVVVLFAKYGKVSTRARKPVKAPAKRKVSKSKAVTKRTQKAPTVRLWHGLPMTKIYNNKKYSLATRFDDDEDYYAKIEAKWYRGEGYSVKTVRLCPKGGDTVKICLYVAKR